MMQIELTEAMLNEIEARINAVKTSPWRSYVEGRDHTCGCNFIKTGTDDARGDDIELIGATVADQDFIASARQDVPILIQEIHRLKKLLHI